MKSFNSSAITLFAFVTVFLGVFIASYLGSFHTKDVLGSVGQGAEYQSTTTINANGIANVATRLIKGGYGSLGTVVITGANTGQVVFYDATTSDATKRSAAQASSSIEIADLPPSLVAGNYIFDVAYGRGLLVSVLTGSVPTSTITYR